jgi:hypothetical protein
MAIAAPRIPANAGALLPRSYGPEEGPGKDLATRRRGFASKLTGYDTTNELEAIGEDVSYRKEWSGREDSNLRPPGPEPGALPG